MALYKEEGTLRDLMDVSLRAAKAAGGSVDSWGMLFGGMS